MSNEPPLCPGPDCLLCNGEACEACGAGMRSTDLERFCEHDIIERHNEIAADTQQRRAGDADWLRRLRSIKAYRSMPPMVLTCQGPDYREPLPGEGPYDGDE
jgi:hypothetical protein